MESNSKLEQTDTKLIEREKKRAFIDRLVKLQKDHNLSDELVEDLSKLPGAENLIDEEILVLNRIIGKFDLDPGFSLEEINFEEAQDWYD